MKRFSVHIGVVVALNSAALWGQSGDAGGTRSALARAAQDNSPAALADYAGYLDRYGDPAAREAYARLAEARKRAGDSAGSAAASHRLAILDLLAGDREAAQRDASASGATVAVSNEAAKPWPTASIPGPLRSFARMAALSPDADLEDVLPALARNVVTNGYEASQNNEALEQTEYLKLVHRYLSQARELEKLAGDQKVINVPNCDSPVVADLTRILGFRMRGGCGSDVVLETVNAARAFLTTDSGFPVNQLEEALRTNHPFVYDFHPTRVPVLFGPEYWMAQGPCGRFHRELHRRPGQLPTVPGLFQTRSGHRRCPPQGRHIFPLESFRSRAGLLRRHVRNPQRHGGDSRRRALGAGVDRPCWASALPTQPSFWTS